MLLLPSTKIDVGLFSSDILLPAAADLPAMVVPVNDPRWKKRMDDW